MNTAQRVIKWCAMAFAVLLICSMVAAIAGAGTLMSYVFGGRPEKTEWTEAVINDEREFRELKINVDATSVKIGLGDYFEVLADHEVIEFRRSGDTAIIDERDRNWFAFWEDIGGEVKITLPRDKLDLRKVDLKFGVGKVEIDGLVTEVLELDQGAGKVELRNVKSTARTKISGGAGVLEITGSELANFDLDMGVGKVAIAAKIPGKSKIDAGVGKLEMRLLGSEEDYRLRIDKGIGSVTVNGQDLSDGYFGEGKNYIEIDGGVGAIEVRTE